MSALFQAICRPLDSLKQGTTNNWILMTPMLAPANSAWVCWLLLDLLCSEITQTRTREFYYPDELYCDKLVFVLSFVSSKSTDEETAEQFILLCTKCVCDFSSLTNYSQKLWKLGENIFVVLSFLRQVFLLLLMLSAERSFASRVCLLIPKVNYWTVHPEKLSFWPPDCLLFASDHEKVVTFFICEECWLSFCAFGVSWRPK